MSPLQPLKSTVRNPAEERPPLVYVKIQGNVLEYKRYCQTSCVPPTRSPITTFSQSARLRMLKFFHRIDFEHFTTPLLITLTYPDEKACPTLEQRNDHRRKFARRLEAFTGREVPAAWRVEWEPRKSGTLIGTYAPHWHILVFRHRYIHYEDINLLWKKTIGHSGYVRTEIRAMRDDSPVKLYMAKYISKDACSPSLVFAAYQTKLGRAYGWLRKDQIPVYPEHKYTNLTDEQRAEFMRLAEETLPWMSAGREDSFTLFGGYGQEYLRILDGEDLTEG